MIRISICGAASYACGELLRLLIAHPEAQVVHLAGTSTAGRRIQDEHPALSGFYDQEILRGVWHCRKGAGRRQKAD